MPLSGCSSCNDIAGCCTRSETVACRRLLTLQAQADEVTGAGFAFSHLEGRNWRFGESPWKDPVRQGVRFVEMGGLTPCCINSTVPSIENYLTKNSGENSTVAKGNVLGTCNVRTSQANITWLGQTYPQDISRARLLTTETYATPGEELFTRLQADVVGCSCNVIIVGLLIHEVLPGKSKPHEWQAQQCLSHAES